MPHVPPPFIALGFAGVQHVVARDEPTGVARRSLAAGVAGTSLWLLGGSAARFRSSHTTVHPLHPERATTLVTDGPNAITRNPMYVGMAGLLVAHALARGGVLTLLPVAGFVAVIDRLQIAPEEAAMERLFGDDYAAYQARVRRWL